MGEPVGFQFYQPALFSMTIQEVFDDLKVPYREAGEHHHTRPGWIQLDCPLCGKDSGGFHLGYNLSLKYFNCWKCGGLYFPKVLEALGLPYGKAKEVHRSVDAAALSRIVRERTTLKEPAGVGDMLPAHREYLEGRGFSPDKLSRIWGLKGIGLAHRLGWRIYIPITHQGVQVSWTTRAIGDRAALRYISASPEQESMSHKRAVYGADLCHHSIVVCEGPADAWAIGPGAGATFGTSFSSSQVKIMSRFPFRFICFDSSKDAQRRAEGLADQLSVFPGSTQNVTLDAKDPGEASRKEIRLLRKIAKL